MTAAGEDDATQKRGGQKKESGRKPFVNVGSVAFAVACFFWCRDECELENKDEQEKNNSVTSDTRADNVCQRAQPVWLNPPL